MKKSINNLLWRLQFKKVKVAGGHRSEGRCIKCDAGNPNVECAEFYCPCKDNEQLKRVKTFKMFSK